MREIDRTERIEAVYRQHGARLEEVPGDWSAPPWTQGELEHSVSAQHRELVRWAEAGGIAVGAFIDNRLVGIGVLVPHIRPRVAQLAYVQVSNGYRGVGIGASISDQLEEAAVGAGCTEMVVSATPSVKTVGFYMKRGFEPMTYPFPELFELEPDDIHLWKQL